jgi:hypothetical protein
VAQLKKNTDRRRPERRRTYIRALIVIIAAIPPTLASIASFVVTMRNGGEVKKEIKEVRQIVTATPTAPSVGP